VAAMRPGGGGQHPCRGVVRASLPASAAQCAARCLGLEAGQRKGNHLGRRVIVGAQRPMIGHALAHPCELDHRDQHDHRDQGPPQKGAERSGGEMSNTPVDHDLPMTLGQALAIPARPTRLSPDALYASHFQTSSAAAIVAIHTRAPSNVPTAMPRARVCGSTCGRRSSIGVIARR